MFKKTIKIFSITLGAAALLVVAFFILLSIFNSPGYAWRIVTLFKSDVDDYKFFPSRTIENGGTYSPLPRGQMGTPYTVDYFYNGVQKTEVLDDLLKKTGTRAFLIVKDDQLIYETYLGSSRQGVNTSFSVAKSFDSALMGAAIADGYVSSVDDLVIQYIPEIAGRGLDTLTIRNLISMDSGIRYRSEDDVLIPFSDDALTYYPPDLRKVALSVQPGSTSIGAAFHYNNFHPLLEGMVIERATGMHVAEYLQERIWKPMGGEFPASWSLDSKASGFERMESGINAAAVDFARFGLIYLHNGYWNGQQILPADWVTESTQPKPGDDRPFERFPEWKEMGGYYGFHWWGLNNADGSYDFTAAGNYGQYIFVSPRKNAVIVRLGEEKDSNVNWALVMESILNQLP